MISSGEITLIQNDAVRNSAPSTPTDVPVRRGRQRERPDVATNPRAKSTRTPTPTFATAKRSKVPAPVAPTKSPEVLNTEIAADLNATAQEFVERHFWQNQEPSTAQECGTRLHAASYRGAPN